MTKSLHAVEIGEHVYTDSSANSFGGWWRNRTIQSKISEQQAELSINSQELLAIYYTLCAFSSSLSGKNVLVHCDNMVAVSCIRKKGSFDCFRDNLTRCIFATAKENNFTIQCVWVKGKRNEKADFLSRKMTDFNPRLEWTIPKDDFDLYMKIIAAEPDVDLFAPHLNNKVDRYCSRMCDPHAFSIDAFTLNWSQFKAPYIFCPFRLLPSVLKKIDEDNVKNAVVIAPLHPSQAWFPRFMSMYRTPPLILPKSLRLYLPWNAKERHLLSEHLRLILGRLCSNFSSKRTSPQELHATFWTMDGMLVQLKGTTLVSSTGYPIVKKRKWTSLTYQ